MARAIGLEIKKSMIWKMEQGSPEQKDAVSAAAAEENQLLTALLEC